MKKSSFKRVYKHFIDKKYKRILLMFIAILLLNSLIDVTTGTNVIKKSVNQVLSSAHIYTEEKKNMTPLKSDGYDSEVGGSIKIEKSADWTGYKKAKINVNVDTIGKKTDGTARKSGYDIFIAVDTSGSMERKDKITHAKNDIKELAQNILSDSNNRMSLLRFDEKATVLTPLTNNSNDYLTQTDTLWAKYGKGLTENYNLAYKKINEMLESEEVDPHRQLVTFLLTDGANTAAKHRTEYQYLKDKYPDMTIIGIQYDMGDIVMDFIKQISDYQYAASIKSLNDVLFNASDSLLATPNESYEYFNLEDVIAEDFEVESVDDIKVSTGTVELENKKVKWNLGENAFKSGNKATMEINVKFTGEVKKGFFPTNDSIKAIYKLPNEIEQTIGTEDTPVLQNGYEVTYEVNAPSDCHNILIAPSKEVHFYGEKVTKQTKELECDNYIFQGWEQAESTGVDIFKTNEETFTMPRHNVLYRGTWSTLNIAKSMEGEVVQEKGNVPFDIGEAQSDRGIKFNIHSSYNNNGNGLFVFEGTENDEYPIYYFRGDKTLPNNVIFANICWKIVRTTETGGIKLIYNGVPTEDNQCTNITGASTQIGKSAFNSNSNNAKYVGYMYDDTSDIAQHGTTESNAKIEIDKWYKINIEEKGYTTHLEDAVWCNDRTIEKISGSNIYYGAQTRLWENNERPKVKDEEVCTNKEDRYTVSDTIKGNGALTYPVGLLTADEVEMAGLGNYTDSGNTYNVDSYLRTDTNFWSLSPYSLDSTAANIFDVDLRGIMSHCYVRGYNDLGGVYDKSAHSLRPSISLRPGTTFTTGDGNMETPYIVEGG